ncbi:multisubstrate pseudouridine synthase 7 [Gnomoniopsis smithogilvyi]|uniref:Multisubstrate pseudouridine synthase 7 n=1 Tax=Gnomoniopsis smithogilvyi TaxID=1191159 RepID=A0A9W8YTU3_9PEZI|nr:multisubstrate pseudouridine synthase 7 [Gnomoniopsis smithogilvyi]
MASPQADQNSGQNATYSFTPSVRAVTEKKMGILHSISSTNRGWTGDVRKRFTDFQVNETRKDGQVLHLTDYALGERPAGSNIYIPGQKQNQPDSTSSPAVAAPAREVTDEDKGTLQSLLGDATTSAVLALYDTTVASGNTRLDPKANSVKFPQMEREDRGRVHKEIRRIFDSKLETETDKDGFIVAVPAPPPRARKSRASGRGKRSNQPSFNELGGDYLHFTLYKENKDTMDAVNQIGRILKVRPNNFGFAGTKDRRAATVQRMSLCRVRHEALDFLNGQIPAFKMGDYKYSKYPIQLGDHGGNQFNITIKNVTLSHGQNESLDSRFQSVKEAVEVAVTAMAKHGFINYYGLQRFGTHVIGTHELGMLILKEDYEGAVNALLHVDQELETQVSAGTIQETPMNRDDINRLRAITEFKTAGSQASGALTTMPRRFSAEINVIEHLSQKRRDFAGAILRISRGMRNLYLHAYQSFVWNHAASYRWEKYGSKVIPGDLVLINTEDTAGVDLEEESHFQRARALSEEEAASGKYSVFDVVLPGPGFDVEYPKNEVGQFYVDFMKQPEHGGLDPHHMRRPIKDFNVSGNYRHLLGRFKGEPKWEVRKYVDDNEQMAPTDLDLIMIRKEEEKKKRKAEVLEDATSTSNITSTTGPVPGLDIDEGNEALLRDSEGTADQAEQPSSKRVKLAEEETRTNTDDGAGATVSTGSGAQVVEPIRQPTVPNGSHGFATTQTNASKPAPVEEPVEPTVARFGQGSIQSFQQADLSNYSEDKIKIAVILEFGLSTSAYATVVLRELMAEVEPENRAAT